MSLKNLQEHVSLKCKKCGCVKFEILSDNSVSFDKVEDDVNVKCVNCGRIFTKKQLLEENEREISKGLEKMKDKAKIQIESEFNKMFRRFH